MAKQKYCNETAVISAEEIEAAFTDTERQYIQGNLQKEQILPYVFSEKSEIGISYYKEFAHDEAHYHTDITETNYVISGRVCVHIVDTNEDFVIGAGGVFSVPPKVVHIFKAQPGTKIIFFKDHSMNDKHIVPYQDLGLEEWVQKKDF